MNVLVCGGRNVGRPAGGSDIATASKERNFVSEYLAKTHKEKPITLVIAGDEGGAERLGLQWASLNKIPTDVYERKRSSSKATIAKTFTKLTGRRTDTGESIAKRNARMLSRGKPDLVIAFGGGEVTKELLQAAREQGIEILEVEIPKF